MTFNCCCVVKSNNEEFLKCIRSEVAESLHQVWEVNSKSLDRSMNLLEYNVVRKYISLTSAVVIQKLGSQEFSVILRENIEFLIDRCK